MEASHRPDLQGLTPCVRGVFFLGAARYNDWGMLPDKGATGLNLPNLLTICRFLLIPAYVVLFMNDYHGYAFLIIMVAGATDILDGYLARSRGQVTQIGTMLDPLADKTMMIVVMLTLLIKGMIPWQAAAVLFFRDIGMIASSAFFHFRGKVTVPANSLGKLTTVFYYVVLLLVFLESSAAIPLLWTVIAFSFIASLVYMAEFKSLNRKSV